MKKRKTYFRGVSEEAKRVRWPNSKQLWKSVRVVLVIAIITASLIALFDYAARQIRKAFGDIYPKASTSTSSGTSEAVARLTSLKNGGLF